MADFLIRTVLESVTGLARDKVVNDFHVHATPALDAGIATVLPAFVNFFTVAGGGAGRSLDNYLSREISRAALVHMVKAYKKPAVHLDPNTGKPNPLGSPVAQLPFTIGQAFSPATSLPGEVSICLSYSLDLTGVPERQGTVHPAARDRGRIFIGPLTTTTLTLGADGDGVQRPALGIRQNFEKVFKQLQADVAAVQYNNVPAVLQQWSTKLWQGGPIAKCWTDDAFDTQRRRGVRPTAKDILTMVP